MQTLSAYFSKTVIVLSLFAVSCKKGDTGPAGATGPVGSANVIYSAWFTPATYKKDTVFGAYGFNYDKATTDITQSIVDSGTVITFGKLDGYNPAIWPTQQVSALPIAITYLVGANPNIDTWSALVTAGNLRIRLVSSLNQYGSISNAHQFRYIVIPGGVKSTASLKPGEVISGNGNALNMAGNNSLNDVILHHQTMGYSEICHALGVPE